MIGDGPADETSAFGSHHFSRSHNTSLTLLASASMVYGFMMTLTPASRMPLWTIALRFRPSQST